MGIIEERKQRDNYSKYIAEHIQNVKKAWREIWLKCKPLLIYNNPGMNADQIYNNITFHINSHDQSKYSFEEFEPYRKNFFPVDEEEKKQNEKDFDRAWVHHYMNNPHHWEYWAENGFGEIEMPYTYIVEMICDWQAMGYKFGSPAKKWYEENKKDIKLAPKTREYVEELLDYLES